MKSRKHEPNYKIGSRKSRGRWGVCECGRESTIPDLEVPRCKKCLDRLRHERYYLINGQPYAYGLKLPWWIVALYDVHETSWLGDKSERSLRAFTIPGGKIPRRKP